MTATIPHSQLAPLPTQVPFRLVSKTIGSGAYAWYMIPCPQTQSSGSTTADTSYSIKKAAPLHTDNPVFAVKFINKNYAQKYGRIKAKQLTMETTLHKHVGLHRNIIEYYDSGEDTTWTWIAKEPVILLIWRTFGLVVSFFLSYWPATPLGVGPLKVLTNMASPTSSASM